MRIYLKLTKNKQEVPFNYQQLLTGVIHKWLGHQNQIHGQQSVISFSWIQNTEANKKGINLKDHSYFFISAFDVAIIKIIMKGILANPSMFHGIQVKDIQVVDVPTFSNSNRFFMASPVLLKVKDENNVRHVTIEHSDFEEVLTLNFKNKLQKAGISDHDLKISLDPNSSYRKTRLITYKGINNKTSLAPIIIEGNPEQIAYAWCVGLGNSTGIGFGALK